MCKEYNAKLCIVQCFETYQTKVGFILKLFFSLPLRHFLAKFISVFMLFKIILKHLRKIKNKRVKKNGV